MERPSTVPCISHGRNSFPTWLGPAARSFFQQKVVNSWLVVLSPSPLITSKNPKIYLDLDGTLMLTYCLIVKHHPRRSAHYPANPLHYYSPSSLSHNSFICHTSEISPVSPIIATDPKSLFRKSFACHTSKTPRGYRMAQATSSPSRELCGDESWLCVLPFAPFRYFITSLRRYFIFSGDHHD